MPQEQWLTATFTTPYDARELEAFARSELPGCVVVREDTVVRVQAPDPRRWRHAEATLARFANERLIEASVRWEEWTPGPARPSPAQSEAAEAAEPEPQPEQEPEPEGPVVPRIVWVDLETLKWEVVCRFVDADAAAADAERLRRMDSRSIFWREWEELTVYVATADAARDLAGQALGVDDVTSVVVRPISRWRSYWMRLHIAGSYADEPEDEWIGGYGGFPVWGADVPFDEEESAEARGPAWRPARDCAPSSS